MTKKLVFYNPLSKKPTYIYIGNNIINNFDTLIKFNNYNKIAIITDSTVYNLYSKYLNFWFPFNFIPIIIKPGEKEKTFKNLNKLISILIKNNFNKNSLIINLGGGVISDLGGFTAGIYMRGIDYINIPTTLLAQVDAANGGKNGINYKSIKNIIGSYHFPTQVIIDINFLKTLPKIQFHSAFGEILKYGIIIGGNYYKQIISQKLTRCSDTYLTQIIYKSCALKLNIIKNDIYDQNRRRILNLGHTIGHSLESVCLNSNKHLTHGEAVAYGIFIESQISYNMSVLPKSELEKITKLIKQLGFTQLPKIDYKKILFYLKKDKKSQNNHLMWSLPISIGSVGYNYQVSDEIIKKNLTQAYEKWSAIT
jgi:3-dehydroquinate synthase